MNAQLNESPTNLFWCGGRPYCYRKPYSDERPESNGYVVVRYRDGSMVKATPELLKRVDDDIRLQAWKRRVAERVQEVKA